MALIELIFPSSPTTGQLFPDPATPGAAQWRWDGDKWVFIRRAHEGGDASISVGPDPPDDPKDGALWFDTNRSRLFVWWDAAQEWVDAAPSDASISAGPNPPDDPTVGALWFDTERLKLFVWFDDGATSQWIVANPSGGPMGPEGPRGERGEVGPQGATGAQGIPGTGFNLIGSLATEDDLPPGGNTNGDTFIVDGQTWTWDGDEWVPFNFGPEGPAGEPGPEGPEGPMGLDGPPGPAGSGFHVVGSVATEGDLPLDGNESGDVYIIEDIQKGAVWDGTQWLEFDLGAEGPLGPVGPEGPPGPQGEQGIGFTVRGEVATESLLPSSGNENGDVYIVTDVQKGFVWTGADWVSFDLGAPGPMGPPGPATGVTSFNTRVGAVTLTGTDVNNAGGALRASPPLTGTPTTPTAGAGTNTTQIASCAFVTGAVNLKANIASPTFTGTPSAPTAAQTVNNTQLATTAYVRTAVAAFAPLASPTFTGVPAGPTAAANTNTTQLATTAYVFGNFVRKQGDTMTGGLTVTQKAGTAAAFGGGLKITAANATATWTGSYGAMSADIMLSKSTGTGLCQVLAGTNGSLRWSLLLGSAMAESGSNVGSPCVIARYNDAGANLGNAIVISRPTGLCTFETAIANGPSDRTMKENIRPITHALDKVLGLQGVTFNMIADETKTPQIGLIAQDVEPIVPEVVQPFVMHAPVELDGEDDVDAREKEPPTIKLALDYPKLTALLIEAVKELTGKCDALQARVAALEGGSRG